MVTDRAGVVLAAPGADCMPILFVDPRSKVIGVAHAGPRVSTVTSDVPTSQTHAGVQPLFLRLEGDPAGHRYGNCHHHGD